MIWGGWGGLKELDDPGCGVRRSPMFLETQSSGKKLSPYSSFSLKVKYNAKHIEQTMHIRPCSEQHMNDMGAKNTHTYNTQEANTTKQTQRRSYVGQRPI